MIEVRVAALKLPLVTQLGSWLYQTQLWPTVLSIRGSRRVVECVHTTKQHAVRLGEVGNLVSTAESEGSTLWLGGVLHGSLRMTAQVLQRVITHPFHAVSGSDLAEHLVVVEDGGVAGIGKLVVVRSSTEVLLARLGCESVELGGGGGRRTTGGGATRWGSRRGCATTACRCLDTRERWSGGALAGKIGQVLTPGRH